jgi:hypothetical protein
MLALPEGEDIFIELLREDIFIELRQKVPKKLFQ